MMFALLKQNITGHILKLFLYFFTIYILIGCNIRLFAESASENPFHNYLIKQFQEKKFSNELSKKIWNYLSNPSKGYKSAGLTSEEFARIVGDYVEAIYLQKIIGSLLEVLSIDTRENLTEERRAESISKYIKHIESVAQSLGLSVVNLENKFLVINSNGEQPPLGIVGKIKISENYLKYQTPLLKDENILSTPVLSSKTAIELALYATGIINSLGIKSHNRILIFVDLSLTSQTNVDTLLNSYEIAPLNLVLDSMFPAVCAEYGYAMIRLVQTVKNENETSLIRQIMFDGGEYQTPLNAQILLDEKRLDREIIEEGVKKFSSKYNKVEVISDGFQIRFSVPQSTKGPQQNALDYLVLFLSENRELYPEGVKIFEYLRRNIILNPSGRGLGINRFHNLLKSTEVILKKVKIAENTYSADIYVRFPFGIDSSLLVEKVKKNIEVFNSRESVEIESYINAYNPIAIDSNSEVATRIRRAYKSVTGENDKCIIADGLYTKLFPNAIGFGPYSPLTSMSFSISRKEILRLTDIYLTALLFLMDR
ncbi:MAG: hypothetical protein ACP5KG_11730 [Myxococcota bacterium]